MTHLDSFHLREVFYLDNPLLGEDDLVGLALATLRESPDQIAELRVKGEKSDILGLLQQLFFFFWSHNLVVGFPVLAKRLTAACILSFMLGKGLLLGGSYKACYEAYRAVVAASRVFIQFASYAWQNMLTVDTQFHGHKPFS
jgi:hypothetical protein